MGYLVAKVCINAYLLLYPRLPCLYGFALAFLCFICYWLGLH